MKIPDPPRKAPPPPFKIITEADLLPTASAYVRSWGLDSLVQVSKITGVSIQTLNSWYTTRNLLFPVIVKGCGGYIAKGNHGRMMDNLSGFIDCIVKAAEDLKAKDEQYRKEYANAKTS